MTPAAHAAVAALAAGRSRRLPVALALSFTTHFPLDTIFHFEAFYPLSVLGRWGLEQTIAGLFALLAALAVPPVLWLFRQDRAVGIFSCYALALSAVSLFPATKRWAWHRLGTAVLVTLLWYVLCSAPLLRRWILCGFCAYLPDALKPWSRPLDRLHEAFHYRADVDLGDWLSLLATGRWQIYINSRIFNPWYQMGYALEIALEGAILFGGLYWLSRLPPRVRGSGRD